MEGGNGTANLGRLVAVAPDGATSAFGAPMDLGPYGMQCGVATSGRWALVAARSRHPQHRPSTASPRWAGRSRG